MNILVAGGAGYIGSCCTEYLLNRGHQVTVVDSLIKGHRDAVPPAADFVKADLADRDAIMAVMAAGKFEGIIHFAAFIEVSESMTEPGRYFANNVGAGINLLDAAVKEGVRKIVFSSTAATYGMPDRVPIPETAANQPINPYGDSKLMFEKILAWYRDLHGLEFTALRYFNAAGATAERGEDHRPETHLIPLVLQVAAGQRKCINIYGHDYPTPDGTCIRDYIHVTDLAQAHARALEKTGSAIYNLGSGTGYSVNEIVEMARLVTGRQITAEYAPRRAGDPAFLISDSSAARRELGWQPELDNVQAIIESAWQWKCQHPDGYAA